MSDLQSTNLGSDVKEKKKKKNCQKWDNTQSVRELFNIQSWGLCLMRADSRDPVLLFFPPNLLFALKHCCKITECVCVCVWESEQTVDSEHQRAPLYIHLCNPLSSSFGHPSTHRAPLPTYIVSDDTFPQLPYQCTGIISQKLLAWEPDGDVWEGRGRAWKSNTSVWTVKTMKNGKTTRASYMSWLTGCERMLHKIWVFGSGLLRGGVFTEDVWVWSCLRDAT